MDNPKTEPAVDIAAIQGETMKGEQKRAAEILEIGERFGDLEQAKHYIKSGKSADEYRAAVLDKMQGKKPISTVSDEIGLSVKEKKNFSLVRAINAAIDQRWDKAPFEFECSRAVEKQFNTTAKGFFVPMDILRRDLTAATEGTDLIATSLLGGSFIELLYKKSVIRSLGAQFLEGIVGNIDIPRMSAGATVYWTASENAGVTESTQTFDKLSLTPKSMGVVSDVSKLLLNQSSMSVENMLVNDIARAIAVEIDNVAFNGASGSDQPVGLRNLSIGAGNFASTTAVTWADIVKMESLIGAGNADVNNMAYVMSAKMRGVLKSSLITATYGERHIWENGPVPGEGIINGYRAVATNVIPDNTSTHYTMVCFGNFAEMIVSIFAPGLDLMVDPYTLAKTRLVSLIAYMDIDLGVRHLASFSKATNYHIS